MADPTMKVCMGKPALKWVEFLAWLQMVTHASHALLIFLVFRDRSMSNLNTVWELLAFFVFGFVMGLVLLRGARRKNRDCLTLWMVYAVAMMLIILSLLLIISERVGLSGPATFIFLIPATMYAFSIWVVKILKSEITAEAVQAVHSHFTVVMALDPTLMQQMMSSSSMSTSGGHDPETGHTYLNESPQLVPQPPPPPAYESFEPPPPTYQQAIQLNTSKSKELLMSRH